MLVPLSWLKDFVDFSLSTEELAERLTMLGLEVEEISVPFDYLKDVVVGSIIKISPHPNADRLKVCEVNLGSKKITVVCGAPNIYEGMLVPVALPGCKLPSGMVIQEAAIRGVKSAGMLCSQRELGIGEDHSGIWPLPDSPLGTPLNQALGLDDIVFDISITPNRGDCLSILGIAREVAAITQQPIKLPEFDIKEVGLEADKEFKVTIENPEHCYRYVGQVIRKVKVAPSPWWLQSRLLLAGFRPINNIVDITNYVMLETGQPLHAFDAHKIMGKHIIVRLAKEGETIQTLDGKTHQLSNQDLLICDDQRPIALAGIMGGFNSEITSDTQDVFLESAYFNPITIRKTAKRLNISTESSYRFERDIDPEGTYWAARRASYLLQTLAQGQVAPGTIDIYPKPYQPPEVNLRLLRLKKILGIDIDSQTVIDILKSLNIKVEAHDSTLKLIPPSYRHDLEREIDFVEEVARVYGYDKINNQYPSIPLKPQALPSHQKIRETIKDIMVGLGWSEIITYAFIDPKSFDHLLLPSDHILRKVTKLLNPLTKERSVMRSTLIPGLLETCSYNHRQQNLHLRLFELGKVFLQEQDELPKESFKLGGAISGYHFDPSWHFNPPALVDFYDLKGHLEVLLKTMGLAKINFEEIDNLPYLDPQAASLIVVNNQPIGYLGRLKKQVQEFWDLKTETYVFEIDVDALIPLVAAQAKRFSPLPKFPFTFRDAAFIVPEHLKYQSIKDFITGLNITYLEDVELIDVYQGDKIPPGTRSLTFRFIYRSTDHTLTDKEVEPIHQEIVKKITNKFNITTR